MDKETLDIEIDSSGEVKVHVQGRKGPACMDIKSFFQDFLGPVHTTERTDEYFEKEEARVNNEQEIKTGRK